MPTFARRRRLPTQSETTPSRPAVPARGPLPAFARTPFLPALALAGALGLGPVTGALAAPVVHLSASATTTAPNDEMLVELVAEQRGADLGQINQAVLAQANAAIEQARARGKAVRAELLGLSTQPAWNATHRRAEGYVVRATVRLRSSDFTALGALTGQLARELQISRASFELSRAQRERLEQSVLTQASTAFKEKARDAAKALGYHSAEIKEVHVNPAPRGGPMPRVFAMEAAQLSDGAPAAHLPAAGGESEVSVSLTGSVLLR